MVPILEAPSVGCNGAARTGQRERGTGSVSSLPLYPPLSISLRGNTSCLVPPEGRWFIDALLWRHWPRALSPCVDQGLSWEGTTCRPSDQAPHGLGYISPFSLGPPMMGVCLSLLLRPPEQGRGCPALTAVLSLSE